MSDLSCFAASSLPLRASPADSGGRRKQTGKDAAPGQTPAPDPVDAARTIRRR